MRFGVPARGDVCAIQTRRTMRDDCVAIGSREDLCPRVIVAYSDEGRAYWEQGSSRNTVAVLADGRRRFLRDDGDVVSTNVPRLVALDFVLPLVSPNRGTSLRVNNTHDRANRV